MRFYLPDVLPALTYMSEHGFNPDAHSEASNDEISPKQKRELTHILMMGFTDTQERNSVLRFNSSDGGNAYEFLVAVATVPVNFTAIITQPELKELSGFVGWVDLQVVPNVNELVFIGKDADGKNKILACKADTPRKELYEIQTHTLMRVMNVNLNAQYQTEIPSQIACFAHFLEAVRFAELAQDAKDLQMVSTNLGSLYFSTTARTKFHESLIYNAWVHPPSKTLGRVTGFQMLLGG